MVVRCAAAVCLSIVTSSSAAFAQQGVADQAPASSISERTYINGGIAPSRYLQRRSESDGRQIVVDTEERLGTDGQWEPVEESVTTTVRPGTGTVQTHRELFTFDAEGRRQLMETTESRQEALDGANTRTVEDTWVADINGGQALTSRWIDETRIIAPDTRQTDSTMFRRGVNGSLRESERGVHTERQVEPAVVRHDTTQLVLDPNGRWAAVEARSAEVRNASASERVDEETIRRPDVNGRLVVSERVVTRRSDVNGQEQVIVETYSPDAEGFARTDNHLALSQRVRRSTTATNDGGRSTVEEIEARSRIAPGDPMRVIQRTVVTVRNLGPDRQTTERQVFELDVNGRLAPVLRETEETAAK
jgi:hypothetical protein